MAYFTDEMGDEFKKAIEKALKQLEEEAKRASEKKKRGNSSNRRSASTIVKRRRTGSGRPRKISSSEKTLE